MEYIGKTPSYMAIGYIVYNFKSILCENINIEIQFQIARFVVRKFNQFRQTDIG